MNKLNRREKFSNGFTRTSNLVAGFTFLEMMIVLAIIALSVVIVISSLNKEEGGQALSTSVSSIISVLNETKSQAVSSKDASGYGVRIFSNKLISFEGTYGNKNSELDLSNLVKISTSTGIGSDIIFNNVSGSTNASGTITITVLSNPSQTSVINVYSTGNVEKN